MYGLRFEQSHYGSHGHNKDLFVCLFVFSSANSRQYSKLKQCDQSKNCLQKKTRKIRNKQTKEERNKGRKERKGQEEKKKKKQQQQQQQQQKKKKKKKKKKN